MLPSRAFSPSVARRAGYTGRRETYLSIICKSRPKCNPPAPGKKQAGQSRPRLPAAARSSAPPGWPQPWFAGAGSRRQICKVSGKTCKNCICGPDLFLVFPFRPHPPMHIHTFLYEYFADYAFVPARFPAVGSARSGSSPPSPPPVLAPDTPFAPSRVESETARNTWGFGTLCRICPLCGALPPRHRKLRPADRILPILSPLYGTETVGNPGRCRYASQPYFCAIAPI